MTRAKELIGKMPREEIAQEINCSLASLKRAFRGVRLSFHNKYAANPKLVREVCAFYEGHGLKKTQARFREVVVRSIVERYKYFSPRQVRWTDSQHIELAKMAGLLSFTEIARYFNRPGANAGSIKSAFVKRFGFGGGSLHGMAYGQAKEIVKKSCPYLSTKFWQSRRCAGGGRRLYLWVDMERYLLDGVPQPVASAVVSMAQFQRWLYGTDDVRGKIIKMINQRGRRK